MPRQQSNSQRSNIVGITWSEYLTEGTLELPEVADDAPANSDSQHVFSHIATTGSISLGFFFALELSNPSSAGSESASVRIIGWRKSVDGYQPHILADLTADTGDLPYGTAYFADTITIDADYTPEQNSRAVNIADHIASLWIDAQGAEIISVHCELDTAASIAVGVTAR